MVIREILHYIQDDFSGSYRESRNGKKSEPIMADAAITEMPIQMILSFFRWRNMAMSA